MSRQDAEISFGAGDDNHIDLSRDNEPLGRYQLELDRHRD
jgi:hypothetical protein